MSDILHDSVEKLHELFEHTDLDTEYKKLREKMEEAKYNPGDVRPLADCIFLLLLAARNRGFKPATVLEELDRVAEDNLRRRWKPMKNGTYRAT